MQARIIQTKTGLIHYGAYGSVDYENEPRVKSTRRGRPVAAPAPVWTKTNDLWGRVPLKAPRGKTGTVYLRRV
jgi:hypothetical protein